ncbi:glycoside hydrolase family 3 N-terminal domain-containing protein [Flavobacterium sp. WC2509]|uniref:glycoside hydrolase family 3 N-terminal domain-containing protein n=1 Tax=Flavobacterium sp. WC2509 TaxID=3461406 RepID=UPI0040448CD3
MKQSLLLILFLSGFGKGFSQKTNSYPYQNEKLPVEARVKDLLGRMSLNEKILQMLHIHDIKDVDVFKGNSYGCVVNTGLTAEEARDVYGKSQKYLKENTRWGIPVLTCTEALHGVYQGNCTIYPQAIAQGSTFNPDLVNRMVQFVAKDLKAMNIKQVLSPDLDIARELRWGRVEETFGEDPFLNGLMGVTYVKNMQANNIVCTPKHFLAHGTPMGGLNLASVSGGERELRSIYMQPFEKVIKEAQPLSIMNSYNSYDGLPVAASSYYLTDLLRKELGFKGYVYSDWSSIEFLNTFHKIASSKAEAAKMAVEAGIDLEAESNCFSELEQLVQEKKLDVKYIDQAVSRILYVKFVSGLFDKPVNENIDIKAVIHSKESVDLAKEIADESIVLLKNNNSILPLSSAKYKSIALIGPNADQFQPGDYSWSRRTTNGITPLQGLNKAVGNNITINYAKGCDAWSQNKEGFQEAISAIKKSDIAVLVVGTESGTFTDNKNVTAGEGYDLSDIKLPGVQEDLIKEIKAIGKPIIVVLVSGKPLAMPWVKDNADAVLVQWYGGEQQGNSLADVLFGKVNPSGKLNVSFPQSVGHLPCYYNYLPSDKGYYKKPGSIDKPGRDYVYGNPDALWSFGHGLSYTTFDYLDATVSKENVKENDVITIDVKIKNTGNVDGKEVVQLYVRDLASSVATPIKQLKGFNKVLVKAGETKTVRLTLPISELFLYNQQMKRVVEPGEFELQIGTSSEDIKIVKKITVI